MVCPFRCLWASNVYLKPLLTMTDLQLLQYERLAKSLQSRSFNEHFAWYEATGRPLGVCAPEGRWYLTNDDLSRLLAADGRGLTGQVFDTFLIIRKPLS